VHATPARLLDNIYVSGVTSPDVKQTTHSEYRQFHLETSSNQFGFKSKHGTDMCVYTLNQITKYYNQRSSPVYICYLDASKAFDRINHWCLFKKLIKLNIKRHILVLSTKFCVRWGNQFSQFFTVSNGIRQGGIMSPILFNIYIDELSCNLNQSHRSFNVRR